MIYSYSYLVVTEKFGDIEDCSVVMSIRSLLKSETTSYVHSLLFRFFHDHDVDSIDKNTGRK